MKGTHVDVRFVVALHSQPRQLSTDGMHGIGEYGRELFVLWEPLNGFPEEVQADTVILLMSPQQVWDQALGLRPSGMVVSMAPGALCARAFDLPKEIGYREGEQTVANTQPLCFLQDLSLFGRLLDDVGPDNPLEARKEVTQDRLFGGDSGNGLQQGAVENGSSELQWRSILLQLLTCLGQKVQPGAVDVGDAVWVDSDAEDVAEYPVREVFNRFFRVGLFRGRRRWGAVVDLRGASLLSTAFCRRRRSACGSNAELGERVRGGGLRSRGRRQVCWGLAFGFARRCCIRGLGVGLWVWRAVFGLRGSGRRAELGQPSKSDLGSI